MRASSVRFTPESSPSTRPDQHQMARHAHDRVGAHLLREPAAEFGREIAVQEAALAQRDGGVEQEGRRSRRAPRPPAPRLEAQIGERLRHLARAALEQRGGEADHALAEARGQILGQAEIEQHQPRPAVGAPLHQEVAGVGIGVEEAVAEDLLAVGLGQQPRHLVGVDSGRAQARHVGDLDAVDELHHQHAARGQLPVDARDRHVVAPAEHARHRLGVVPLVHEVELAGHVAGQLVDQRHQVEVALHEVDGPEQHAQVGQVAAHQRLDLGILDLDGHPLAAPEHRLMHLGQRGRSDRLALDRGEDIRQVAAQLALDRLLHHREGLGRHPVLQLREHLDVLAREHVGARAEKLAALQDQAAQLDRRFVDRLRAGPVEARPALRHVARAQPLGDEAVGADPEVDAAEGGPDPARSVEALGGGDRRHGGGRHQSSGGFDGHDHASPREAVLVGSRPRLLLRGPRRRRG